MLRLTICFLITALLFTAGSTLVPQSTSNITRLTNTPEHAVNLNPTLSDNGRVVVFESSADLTGLGDNSFHTYRVDLAAPAPYPPTLTHRAGSAFHAGGPGKRYGADRHRLHLHDRSNGPQVGKVDQEGQGGQDGT